MFIPLKGCEDMDKIFEPGTVDHNFSFIIGYSKEYIDEKFEEIVAFAELEGFMDERMKNFSSGMVSRLGAPHPGSKYPPNPVRLQWQSQDATPYRKKNSSSARP